MVHEFRPVGIHDDGESAKMPQTYTGEIRDGLVIFDGTPPPLPSGTRVRMQIEPIAAEGTATPDEEVIAKTRELLLRWAKVAEATAPPMLDDMALEHDHYAHGKPRGD
jgi:hypothetical protein